MKRILTYGTFDLLHYGHIRLLQRAKALGDYLIVAVSTDEFNELKGITDEDDKHYKLLNIDSIKNRYNDIKPCKHYL